MKYPEKKCEKIEKMCETFCPQTISPMPIQRLPDYLINRIKAGEVVERPASIIKELIENSLDAHATEITIDIADWWKKRISIHDNGNGISATDIPLVLERYATSKIMTEEDLYALASFGFRWEALASIAEVSDVTIQTKTIKDTTGTQISKQSSHQKISTHPVPFDHGTIIHINDLFAAVPARQKFLKSWQTEYSYCLSVVIDFALTNIDTHFRFVHNEKVIFDLPETDSMIERINALYRKNRTNQCKTIDYVDKQVSLQCVIGDASLHFPKQDYLRFYVNGRPVQDKIIKRALLESYKRQLVPGEYPFAIIMFDCHSSMVDVNVHPRKQHVKFLDPWSIYHLIHSHVSKALSGDKVIGGTHNHGIAPQLQRTHDSQTKIPHIPVASPMFSARQPQFSSNHSFWPFQSIGQKTYIDDETEQFSYEGETFVVIGQLRDMYIIMQSRDALYYVDQHALAERIAFEKLRVSLKASQWQSELLLQPLTISIPATIDIDSKLDQLSALWFDLTHISDHKITVYGVPVAFVSHQTDIEELILTLMHANHVSLESLFDEAFAMKACKTSIKAGDRLSLIQMRQLVKDGFDHIPWMFVCQHGRPFVIKIEKGQIDKLFDRH